MALTKVSRGLLTTSIVDNGNATAITIDSNENVGIGTSSPAGTIDAVVDSTGGLKLTTNTSAGVTLTAYQGSTNANVRSLDIDAQNFVVNTGAPTGTTVTERMRIDSAGSVGIGTSSPSSYNSAGNDLVIASAGAGLTIASATNNSGHILFADSTSGTGAYAGFIRYDHTTDSMRFAAGAGTERMRIAASGATTVTADTTSDWALSVSNGTNSNAFGLYVNAPSTSGIPLRIDGGGAERFRIDANGSISIPNQNAINELTFTGTEFTNVVSATTSGFQFGTTGAGYLAFLTNNAEQARITSAGDLLVGQSSTTIPGIGNTTAGVSIRGTDGSFFSRALGAGDTNSVVSINRSTADGNILGFQKDGTTVGSIGNSGTRFVVHGTFTSGAGLYFGSNVLLPTNNAGTLTDGVTDLGQTAYRFDDIYATNGTIQTSDRNQKQDIAELSDAEKRVAVAAKGLLRKFRWKDSVAEKGDEARTHFGIIAQDLQAAFAAEGLDASDYAMFISTTWTDEETNEEKTRMGIRYSELLAFIISAI